MKNLIYRRQFLLTTQKIQFEIPWKENKLKYQSSYTIYSHPDLEYTHVSKNEFELHLLGFVLDPHHPHYTNQDILNNLSKAVSFDALTAATDTLTGRFVIIYSTRDTVNIFHDATGFREVYYYQRGNEFACGSSPDIIAHYLKVERDDEKEINQFFNSPQLNNAERKWIGVRTIFKGIKKLLPNHYVNFPSNKSFRYWPREERPVVDLKKAAEYSAEILKGTYASALNRYKLHQTITSGWDTRLLLAACKNHISNLQFYFLRGFKADKGLVESGDYLITKKISDKYNLPTQFIVMEDITVDPEFERIYYSNNILARPKLLKLYYAAYQEKLDDVITVSGTLGNSLLRLQGGLNNHTEEPEIIAHKLKYEKFPFVVDSIAGWIEASRSVKTLKYNLMDMFYWEHYLGNWGALSGAEQDIVRDELRPFNNRELISTLGCVHDKYRYRDYPENYVKTIKLLWPELLNFSNDIEYYKIKKALRAINLEQLADKVYQRIKA